MKLSIKKIEEQLTNSKLQSKIKEFNKTLIIEVCSDSPHAFCHRKRHIVMLSYAKEFKECLIPTLIIKVCSDLPHAFCHRKRHIVMLSYAKEFKEHLIPTKARPIQMNHEQMKYCKIEINDLIKGHLYFGTQSLYRN